MVNSLENTTFTQHQPVVELLVISMKSLHRHCTSWCRDGAGDTVEKRTTLVAVSEGSGSKTAQTESSCSELWCGWGGGGAG